MTIHKLAALAWLTWALAGSAQAATLDVCPVACTYSTIQPAVDAAVAGDVIDIAGGTYAGDVEVTVSDLTIQGAGSGTTIVEGVGFAAFIFRDTATPARLTGVTLRSPAGMSCLYNYQASLVVRDSVLETCTANIQIGASNVGGAIYTSGDLVLRRVTVRNNVAGALQNGLGGGLYVGKDLSAAAPVVRIFDSEFSGNSAFSGGAIYVEAEARVFVDNTVFTSNVADGTGANDYNGRGGAIYTAGELTLTNSTLSGNFADMSGGGVAVLGSQDTRIANSIFTSNSASSFQTVIPAPSYTGGGLFVESSGTVTVTGSKFEGNTARNGGAIGSYNLLNGGAIEVTGSSLSSNTALYGGAVYAFGGQPVVLSRTTISGNVVTASGGGGGVYSDTAATVALRSATVSGNISDASGGGVSEGGGSIVLRNTIVAANSALFPYAGGSSNDCTGALDSEDFNLVGTLGGCGLWAQANDLSGTDATPIDALLLPLGDNGGLTPSMLPNTGSPAIDSGGKCSRRDQRGFLRPVDGGTGANQCDRGAVEIGGACTAPVAVTVLEPAPGAGGVAAQPLFVWEPAYNALTYDVALSTQQAPFPAGIIATTLGRTATTWKPVVTLASGTTYYWRVVAHSACGRTSVNPVIDFITR